MSKARRFFWLSSGLFLFSFFCVFIFYVPILNAIADWLTFETKIDQADVIVVLSGDTGERDRYGATLYYQGLGRNVLLSGGPVFSHKTYAEIMAEHMKKMGIPASKLILEERSRSTYENALFSRPILLKRKVKKAILVTSSYHMRRSYLVFKKIFRNDNIQLYAAPVPLSQSSFNPHGWWKRSEDTEEVFSEYAKLLYYKFKGWL